jgi:hypothetical protein
MIKRHREDAITVIPSLHRRRGHAESQPAVAMGLCLRGLQESQKWSAMTSGGTIAGGRQ